MRRSTTMVEGQSMTVADVVAGVRDGRLEDFVREGCRVGRQGVDGVGDLG
jgi:hypothetical protein